MGQGNKVIWICAHTQKCGWWGEEKDLVYVPKKGDDTSRIKSSTGTCPRCGGQSFTLKNEPPNRLAAFPLLPLAVKEALDRYVADHSGAGHFVMAVLRNDLTDAVCRADSESLRGLRDIVHYVYNELPKDCWGSKEKVDAWLQLRNPK